MHFQALKILSSLPQVIETSLKEEFYSNFASSKQAKVELAKAPIQVSESFLHRREWVFNERVFLPQLYSEFGSYIGTNGKCKIWSYNVLEYQFSFRVTMFW